jgi:diaminohydroxyphosphoribosylaminopyrimidine deaminase/5-amino-6-(5-phosphoribosylamino)uracil reductase
MNDQDKGFMDQAIEQAKLDPRRDHPVGAVVVSRDGSFCAAAHGLKGEALEHAEERLFNQTRDVDLTGGTLYTTLEPCMMRYKAGYLPCAHLVSKRKIRRVVIGLLDPNP